MRIPIEKISITVGEDDFECLTIHDANMILLSKNGPVSFTVKFGDNFEYSSKSSEHFNNLAEFILNEWKFLAAVENTNHSLNWSQHVTKMVQNGTAQKFRKYLEIYYFGPPLFFLVYIGQDHLVDQRGRYCIQVKATDYFACQKDHTRSLPGKIVATYTNSGDKFINSISRFSNPFDEFEKSGNPVFVRIPSINEMTWRYTSSEFDSNVEKNTFEVTSY